jgi:hypothetical protein
MSLRARSILLIALVLLPGVLFSADVLFIESAQYASSARQDIELACQFYGLTLRVQRIEPGRFSMSIPAVGDPAAIIVSAPALIEPSLRKLFSRREAGVGAAPLLIVDITPSTEASLLQEISAGRILGCGALPEPAPSGRYIIGDNPGIAGHLSGRSFDFRPLDMGFLRCGSDRDVPSLIRIAIGQEDPGSPVFFGPAGPAGRTFFLTDFRGQAPKYVERPTLDLAQLLESLPILMFLRYAGGERCWRAPGYFANLTIDDPWLREPYGSLRYKALLAEMEKSHFHTTIAFIPWNYDRSQEAVAALFREHPSRFSICIHGNDHDHSEFTDPNSASHREADIVQGLARMEAFTRLTGIGFDRVMVFPHTIADDAETLGLLKKHNFLATFNQDNVPLSLTRPRDLAFYLRDVTLDYADFPSVNRSGIADQSETDFALELFLGNPILLYDHHTLFRKGMDRFNRLAETINKLEPSLRWTTLGDIARHLYLTREREDGDHDVLAFCRSIELDNPGPAPKTFHIHKPESFQFPILKLTANDVVVPYETTPDGIDLVLEVPAGARRVVSVEYRGDDVGTPLDIARTSKRAAILRRLSDFRDIQLSSFPLGQKAVDFFYQSGAYRYARGWTVLVGLALLVLAAVLLVVVLKRARRARARRRAVGSALNPKRPLR